MIEAQQKNINRSPESRMRTIAIDSGVSQFRRMMNEMMLAEKQNEAATGAAGA